MIMDYDEVAYWKLRQIHRQVTRVTHVDDQGAVLAAIETIGNLTNEQVEKYIWEGENFNG